MVSDTLDKFKSVRGPRSCGTLSIRGKRRGGLIEKLENLNTLVKTNGEGRAKEEDKGGAKCESSISMGTFAFRLNFWRSTLLFDICLSSANTPQTIRFLSLSLSHDIPFFLFFSITDKEYEIFERLSNFIIKKFFSIRISTESVNSKILHFCE